MSTMPDQVLRTLTASEKVSIKPWGFEVNTVWSPETHEHFQTRVTEKKEHGYYQAITIGDLEEKKITTPGTHLTHAVLPNIDKVGFPANFQGKTVLDIGCNAGFYSTIAKLRGASRVVGVDHAVHYVEQAKLISEMLGIQDEMEFRLGDGHDLTENNEQFDIVINTGVMYHLENPMDFLRKVSAVTRELMFLETEAILDPTFTEHAWFIEKEYGRDPSNWWIYGPTCMERMIRAAGFSKVECCGFLWKPEPGERVPEGFLRQGRATFLAYK